MVHAGRPMRRIIALRMEARGDRLYGIRGKFEASVPLAPDTSLLSPAGRAAAKVLEEILQQKVDDEKVRQRRKREGG